MAGSYKQTKLSTPNLRVQKNFYIRIRHRLIWEKAHRKAEDDGTNLYQIITTMLEEWIRNV